MRASVAHIFDQLHLGVGIADKEAAIRRLGDMRLPIGSGSGGGKGKSERRADRRQQPEQKPHQCSLDSITGVPLVAATPAASASSTAFNSGSPIARRLVPSSTGAGLSDGGAWRGARLATSPCRIVTRATAP